MYSYTVLYCKNKKQKQKAKTKYVKEIFQRQPCSKRALWGGGRRGRTWVHVIAHAHSTSTHGRKFHAWRMTAIPEKTHTRTHTSPGIPPTTPPGHKGKNRAIIAVPKRCTTAREDNTTRRQEFDQRHHRARGTKIVLIVGKGVSSPTAQEGARFPEAERNSNNHVNSDC